MRVCLVTGEFPPMQGGVGDYTRCLAEALARQGCQVSVVTSVRAAGGEGAERVRVLPVVPRWDFSCWGVLLRAFADLRPQTVNIQYQPGAYQMHGAVSLLPLRLRLSRGPASVVTFHDLRTPHLFPKAGPLRPLARNLMARTADAAITTNPEDAGALGSPSHLIPIGSNIPPIAPPEYDRDAQRAQWGVGPKDLLLAYFGFLNPRKGIETLFGAMRRLRNAGRSVVLLMVGGMASDSVSVDRSHAERVRTEVEASSIAERIRWTGFTSAAEVTANLLAADLCVLPFRDGASFRNGTLAAAIAHGLALVTTCPPYVSPSAAEAAQRSGLQLVDSVNARLVPPDDEAALAAAILELAADAGLRHRLHQGALKLAELLEWETIARQTVAVYRDLVRA